MPFVRKSVNDIFLTDSPITNIISWVLIVLVAGVGGGSGGQEARGARCYLLYPYLR